MGLLGRLEALLVYEIGSFGSLGPLGASLGPILEHEAPKSQIFSSQKAPAGTTTGTKGLKNSKSQIFSSQKAPAGTTPATQGLKNKKSQISFTYFSADAKYKHAKF